jgi:indole-3-glycerol phosphate synthase
MKDFIISEYQIYEGVLAGASAVLLIVAMLSRRKLRKFLKICKQLNISALVEVHSVDELKKCAGLDDLEILGVNSRNLKTLEVDLSMHEKIISKLPAGVLKVAESGINAQERVQALHDMGYNAVLVGEGIVISDNPKGVMSDIKSVGSGS